MTGRGSEQINNDCSHGRAQIKFHQGLQRPKIIMSWIPQILVRFHHSGNAIAMAALVMLVLNACGGKREPHVSGEDFWDATLGDHAHRRAQVQSLLSQLESIHPYGRRPVSSESIQSDSPHYGRTGLNDRIDSIKSSLVDLGFYKFISIIVIGHVPDPVAQKPFKSIDMDDLIRSGLTRSMDSVFLSRPNYLLDWYSTTQAHQTAPEQSGIRGLVTKREFVDIITVLTKLLHDGEKIQGIVITGYNVSLQ